MAVQGFPTRPGDGLIKASSKFKVARVPGASKAPSQSVKGVKARVSKRRQLGVAPVATGSAIMGASTSTSRVGY